MNTQMDTCYECKNTLDKYDFKECKPCAVFVCFDCIQSCSLAINYGVEDNYECGEEDPPDIYYMGEHGLTLSKDGSVLHKGCDFAQLDVCDCDKGIWGGTKCEVTFCANHYSELGCGSCMDCDQSRCPECYFLCESCYSPSCKSSECGGSCDSCNFDFCEECLRQCPAASCTVKFCCLGDRLDPNPESCSTDENNIKHCKICDRYSCIDHVEHECAVK